MISGTVAVVPEILSSCGSVSLVQSFILQIPHYDAGIVAI
ncbi:hypothetical protein SPHINGOR109_50331 [Sphingorhabdus sp. 109]|nr:hypothetical protein SPHINGOR109_50331 [Sphingorhabdus sp. 109]